MTDLTDRMRTCAAFMRDRMRSDPDKPVPLLTQVISDVAELLDEAATELEKPIEVRLGTPMEVIEAVQVIEPPLPNTQINRAPQGFWYNTDPGIPDLPSKLTSRNACPKCDSRAAKAVRAQGRRIVLSCPVCGNMWQR